MERRRVRRRAMALSMIAVLLLVVACGRATEQQIEQALGITPEPTVDPAETSVVADASGGGAATPGSGDADANAGVAALGRTKFQFNCQTCHSPSGTAPDLLAKGGIGTDIDYATLYPILREGEGHSPAPGPYETFVLTDADIANIGAYIREQAAP